MSEQDIIRTLQSDIAVPQVVQDKANAAFEQIRNRDAGSKTRKARFPKKKIVILAAAAVLALGSITVFAAYRSWSRSLSEGMRVSEEQRVQLEEEGAVVFPSQGEAREDDAADTEAIKQSQTCNGVTVTAVQSITDNYAAHLVFKVEGYDLPEGAEPLFEHVDVTLDGGTAYNMSASFYNGLVTGENGMAVYADGSPIVYEGNIARYVQDDGSMEYWITLFYDEKGYFLDKDVHVEFENLGTAGKAEYLSENEVQGRWSFDWNLKGTDSAREFTLDEALGDTGATVTRAEISPITMHVEYQFPYQTRTEQIIDENGNFESSEHFVEAPPLVGVRLKDGTAYPYLCNGGSEGYQGDPSNGDYYGTYVNDRIIDPDEVAYILFGKAVDDDGQYSEHEFYEVPVNQ